ncbi:hemolysin III family protein [Mycolicibacillus parakoreensis]|uniref:Hemolysin III family protein n=2 Tax=Mycolicibacillus parakoreensis TaxID=1069221 RepID=A0ABY3U5R1_9MYCO|nr:hemolysin III family protein [Mycolicibacillus parakoreensis]MCV7315120.1 hemolysin III family protein [Mycolicibacillus parakoreensis]ULN54455.1 hemolysin III family protein [Mycolicibacillus parakoreensis]
MQTGTTGVPAAAAPAAPAVPPPAARPRARGWIHLVSAIVAVAAGATLIAVTWPLAGLEAGLSTFIYTVSVVGMFAVSATYHRITWQSVNARIRMKRLDHAMIFVFIAGTYTPFAVLAMTPAQGEMVLLIVWGGALAGVLLKLCWPTAPKWVGVPLYLLLGWVSAFYIAAIMHHAGVAAMVLLAVGGVLYSVGAILYALKWPDPWPATFGYHEFFHACTAIAAICQYIAIWFAALY